MDRAIFVGLFACIITACAPGSDSKSGGNQGTQLEFKPLAGPALSEAQKRDLRESIAKTNSTNLDEFLLISSDESATDRAKKQNELNPSEVRLLQQARQNCEIVPPAKKQSGAWTTPGSSKIETSRGTVGGPRCPIKATQETTTTTTLVQLADATKSGVFHLDSRSSFDYAVLDHAVGAQVARQNSRMEISTTGDLITTLVAPGQTKSKSQFTLEGKGDFVEGNDSRTTMSFRGQILTDEQRDYSDVVMHVRMNLHGTEYVLSMHMKGNMTNEQNRTTEYYLNGEKSEPIQFGMIPSK